MYLPGSISLCLQLSITEYMKALSTADLSLPILPALRRFILSFLTLCSLILFDTSTSPLSSTRFIAGHSALAYRMAFFQQLSTSGIIRQSIVGKSILYRTHQVGSAARLEPDNISFSACHVLLLEAVFLCEGHPCSVYEPHRLIVVLFQCVLIYIKQTDFINIYNRSKAITNPIRAYRILREA